MYFITTTVLLLLTKVRELWRTVTRPALSPDAFSAKDWATAVHEAGHCIAAHHSRYCPPTLLSMRPTTVPNNAAGIFRHKVIEPNLFDVGERLKVLFFSDDILRWEKAIISLGALAAELELLGKARSGPAANDIRSALDSLSCVEKMDCPMQEWRSFQCSPFPLEKVWRGELSSNERHRVQVAWRQARFLVRTNRKRVEALALELVSRGELDSTDINRILRRRT